MRFIHTTRKAGEAVQAPELFRTAWDEFIELQVMDKQTWLQHTLGTLACLDRYELGLHNGDHTVGGVILARDNDIHIGDCLAVVAQYVMPDYRNTGVSMRCMRECCRIAKALGHTHLAYTHRIKDWQYATIYKELK